MHTENDDNLQIVLKTAGIIKNRKFLAAYVPLITRNEKLKLLWVEIMEKIETGEDDYFANIYLKLYKKSKGKQRMLCPRYLNLMRRIPCQKIYPKLWKNLSTRHYQEQIEIPR